MNREAADELPGQTSQPGQGVTAYEVDRRRLQTAQLSVLILATILSLLVMSLGVNLFIFKQMRGARMQLAAARVAARNLAEQYQVKEPAMRQFIQALQAFAATHPDFLPILERYRPALPQFFLDTTPILPAPSIPRPSLGQ